MKTGTSWLCALLINLLSLSANAAVSSEEALSLGKDLTPVGGERAGNSAGTIPPWAGGLPKDAGQENSDGFLDDPFANEKPLFTITAENVEQYKENLSEGQIAMFKRYPGSYRMVVYPSHRTVSLPDDIYAAIKTSALKTEAIESGNGLRNFSESRYYAFPIPRNGLEVIWNHITRYRGRTLHRSIVQVTPQVSGDYTLVRFEDKVGFPDGLKDLDASKSSNALLYYTQRVTAPSRLAGNVLLVHESIDQVSQPRMAWLYNAGQRRVRRAPQVAYDGPGTAADGLATVDNFDMYNGAPDRYEWRLVGKRELYIPYNNYKLDSQSLKYSDIVKPGHTNQDLARYELHRVWEVEATLKPGERHIYAKRRFFLDEDSWQIAVSEQYDARGQLWRVGQAMLVQQYKAQVPLYAFETLNDLTAGRYLAIGMKNEEKHGVEFGIDLSATEFTPAALRNSGVR
ncbi:DUF1329 domain-containing protein [Pseudomonas sp. TCU-HL1]|uniref:DUF1329 domain-containing protein n=1 Tax=Pseudomonas sp. TCU-HL1 TaxID=1856685 RepID=UPI00083E4717|nr:DUF1329 domain-containing protein [Pseudomonas sp. TCU-HL1]AOE85235.1 hypothetical protein THL1_2687 [Pseudomonas sp. TCU-HL1]